MPHGNRQPSGRPPVLDDSEGVDVRLTDNIWIDMDPTDDAESARYWAAKHGEALTDIRMLQSDLSAARFQRDVWWPLAFCVGVISGALMAVLW